MFDISVLKTMKLTELQEIAKAAKTIKFTGVKKDDLITAIVQTQQKSVSETAPAEAVVVDNKPKRARINQDAPGDKTANLKNLFATEKEVQTGISEKPESENIAESEATTTQSKFKKGPKFITVKDQDSDALPENNVVTTVEVVDESVVSTEETVAENPNQQRKKIPNVNANLKNPNQQKNNQIHNQGQGQNQAPNGNQNPNFKPKKVPNFRDSDYEFDGIIESEGVLEMMPDGYGFLRSSDYNY
ncbi:MAG: Rho termination factor N-terminal domain-containing protein, partial [Flavobacterium sp.]|nr:Rho termination factor N-terminal domain-containing protein [Flavobacterium sp.]